MVSFHLNQDGRNGSSGSMFEITASLVNPTHFLLDLVLPMILRETCIESIRILYFSWNACPLTNHTVNWTRYSPILIHHSFGPDSVVVRHVHTLTNECRMKKCLGCMLKNATALSVTNKTGMKHRTTGNTKLQTFYLHSLFFTKTSNIFSFMNFCVVNITLP